jgi:hypothetical protein
VVVIAAPSGPAGSRSLGAATFINALGHLYAGRANAIAGTTGSVRGSPGLREIASPA